MEEIKNAFNEFGSGEEPESPMDKPEAADPQEDEEEEEEVVSSPTKISTKKKPN